MERDIRSLYFTGYCYWSMEAIFSHLRAVQNVQSGWVSTEASSEIEAVSVVFSPNEIAPSALIAIHLSMHRSDLQQGIKKRYPSKVCTEIEAEIEVIQSLIEDISQKSKRIYYCKAERLSTFRPAEKRYDDYYLSGPEKPYCHQYIRPKLDQLKEGWPGLFVNKNKVRE